MSPAAQWRCTVQSPDLALSLLPRPKHTHLRAEPQGSNHTRQLHTGRTKFMLHKIRNSVPATRKCRTIHQSGLSPTMEHFFLIYSLHFYHFQCFWSGEEKGDRVPNIWLKRGAPDFVCVTSVLLKSWLPPTKDVSSSPRACLSSTHYLLGGAGRYSGSRGPV